jgi:voltage-gated potassium channel
MAIEMEVSLGNMLHETFRDKSYRIILGTSTTAGQRFDVLLMTLIVLSSVVVILSSIESFSQQYGLWLLRIEWTVTVIFTIEYLLRIYASPWPRRYIFSFYGLVDLLSFLPSYLAFFFTGDSYWLIVRLLRLLRVFRVPGLFMYLAEVNLLIRSIYASRRKLLILVTVVTLLNIILGCLLFVLEGQVESIPAGIQRILITMMFLETEHLLPQTMLGQFILLSARFMGWATIATLTGIFTVQIAREMQVQIEARRCDNCGRMHHDVEAKFCLQCGAAIKP